MTAPQEVSFWRGKELDEYETSQATVRIKYIYLNHPFKKSAQRECDACGHCGARCFLEGLSPSGGPATQPTPAGGLVKQAVPVGPTIGGAASAAAVVKELTMLKGLKDRGLIDSPGFKCLRDGLMTEFTAGSTNMVVAGPPTCLGCGCPAPCQCSLVANARVCVGCGDPTPCSCS